MAETAAPASPDVEELNRLNSYITRGDLESVVKFLDTTQACSTLCDRLSEGIRAGHYRITCPFPVGQAAACGHVEIMNSLISRGFSPNEISSGDSRSQFRRPIHFACSEGQVDTLRSLVIDHKVDIRSKDEDGNTPLFWAILKGTKGVVKFLIEEGVSVNESCSKWHLPPICIVGWGVEYDSPGRLAICDYLISQGADVNDKDSKGSSALWPACVGRKIEIIEKLIQYGADINAAMPLKSKTHLHWICGCPRAPVALLRLCFSRGAVLEATDIHGMTPLHTAVMAQAYQTVHYLVVEGNVSLDTRCHDDTTPLRTAIITHRYKRDVRYTTAVAWLLVKAGYRPTWRDLQDEKDFRGREVIPPGLRPLIDSLQKAITTCYSLTEICCFQIRKALGGRLSMSVDRLPLPAKLKEFIRLRHIPPDMSLSEVPITGI